MDGTEALMPEEASTSDAGAGLASRIEAAVRATPGVRNVYRSGSLISNLLRAGAAALGTHRDGEPIVSVVRGKGGGVAVEASIGVDVASRAAAILRSAHEAIDALLRADGLTRENITLTIVYVQSREAS